MSDPWMVAATLAAALIGGGITAGTGWFLERKRLTVQEGRQRELFVTALLDDLQHSLSLYDRLIEDYDKSHVIWFSTLSELEQSRAFYTQFASHLLLLTDADLRKRIFRYYLKSNELFGTLRLHQQRIHHYQLKRSEVVADIGVRQPGLSELERLTLAIKLLTREKTEHDFSEQQVPKELAKSKDFKSDAQKLLDDLKSYQQKREPNDPKKKWPA